MRVRQDAQYLCSCVLTLACPGFLRVADIKSPCQRHPVDTIAPATLPPSPNPPPRLRHRDADRSPCSRGLQAPHIETFRYARSASRISAERFTRARFAAPSVARRSVKPKTTWMVSILWSILHTQLNNKSCAIPCALAPLREIVCSFKSSRALGASYDESPALGENRRVAEHRAQENGRVLAVAVTLLRASRYLRRRGDSVHARAHPSFWPIWQTFTTDSRSRLKSFIRRQASVSRYHTLPIAATSLVYSSNLKGKGSVSSHGLVSERLGDQLGRHPSPPEHRFAQKNRPEAFDLVIAGNLQPNGRPINV